MHNNKTKEDQPRKTYKPNQPRLRSPTTSRRRSKTPYNSPLRRTATPTRKRPSQTSQSPRKPWWRPKSSRTNRGLRCRLLRTSPTSRTELSQTRPQAAPRRHISGEQEDPDKHSHKQTVTRGLAEPARPQEDHGTTLHQRESARTPRAQGDRDGPSNQTPCHRKRGQQRPVP